MSDSENDSINSGDEDDANSSTQSSTKLIFGLIAILLCIVIIVIVIYFINKNKNSPNTSNVTPNNPNEKFTTYRHASVKPRVGYMSRTTNRFTEIANERLNGYDIDTSAFNMVIANEYQLTSDGKVYVTRSDMNFLHKLQRLKSYSSFPNSSVQYTFLGVGGNVATANVIGDTWRSVNKPPSLQTNNVQKRRKRRQINDDDDDLLLDENYDEDEFMDENISESSKNDPYAAYLYQFNGYTATMSNNTIWDNLISNVIMQDNLCESIQILVELFELTGVAIEYVNIPPNISVAKLIDFMNMIKYIRTKLKSSINIIFTLPAHIISRLSESHQRMLTSFAYMINIIPSTVPCNYIDDYKKVETPLSLALCNYMQKCKLNENKLVNVVLPLYYYGYIVDDATTDDLTSLDSTKVNLSNSINYDRLLGSSVAVVDNIKKESLLDNLPGVVVQAKVNISNYKILTAYDNSIAFVTNAKNLLVGGNLDTFRKVISMFNGYAIDSINLEKGVPSDKSIIKALK